ncbi:MAG: hypothetical protein M3280_05725 [Actinomycetota bacterium]|nr:hypothetical protein [Actinomycetota bacterium]
MSSRRAYTDAIAWIKSARPRRLDKWRFSERAFGAALLAAAPLLGGIALVSPDSFGAPGSNTLQTGWPLYVLLGLVGLSLALVLARASTVRWLMVRVREPFIRPFEGDARFEGAADALARCPAPLRSRFAVSWIWGPVALAGLGTICAFSTAYFLVDAILVRFEVGLEQPIYAAAFAAASLGFFRLAATRLATWRLAVNVHRAVTQGF